MANDFGRRGIPVDSGTPDLVQESIVGLTGWALD